MVMGRGEEDTHRSSPQEQAREWQVIFGMNEICYVCGQVLAGVLIVGGGILIAIALIHGEVGLIGAGAVIFCFSIGLIITLCRCRKTQRDRDRFHRSRLERGTRDQVHPAVIMSHYGLGRPSSWSRNAGRSNIATIYQATLGSRNRPVPAENTVPIQIVQQPPPSYTDALKCEIPQFTVMNEDMPPPTYQEAIEHIHI